MSKRRNIYLFDIDETLFKTYAKVNVINKSTKEFIKELTTEEYNHYTLKDNEQYDYAQFICSQTFKNTSKPIEKMINKLIKVQSDKNNEVYLLTAREDMNNKDLFLQYLREHGINAGHKDNNEVHVIRTGNLKGGTVEGGKLIYLKELVMEKINLKEVNIYLYDDHLKNVTYLMKIVNDNDIVKNNIEINYYAELVKNGETIKTVTHNNNKFIDKVAWMDILLPFKIILRLFLMDRLLGDNSRPFDKSKDKHLFWKFYLFESQRGKLLFWISDFNLPLDDGKRITERFFIFRKKDNLN